MSETVEKEVKNEDSIIESVDNLTDLSEEIESVKQRKRENLNQETNANDSVSKPYQSGVIVPKPDDQENIDTGETRRGEVCVWVKNKSTGEYHKDWLKYPNSEDEYSKDNEYVRLCKYLGVKTDEPQDMLYEEVPISKEENNSLRGTRLLNLPQNGTKISVFKHKTMRTIKNIISIVSQKPSLVITLNLIMYYLIFRNTIVSIPSFVPENGADATAMGYPSGVGLLVFLSFCLFIFVVGLANISITIKYVLPALNSLYDNIKLGINKLIDREYIE